MRNEGDEPARSRDAYLLRRAHSIATTCAQLAIVDRAMCVLHGHHHCYVPSSLRKECRISSQSLMISTPTHHGIYNNTFYTVTERCVQPFPLPLYHASRLPFLLCHLLFIVLLFCCHRSPSAGNARVQVPPREVQSLVRRRGPGLPSCPRLPVSLGGWCSPFPGCSGGALVDAGGRVKRAEFGYCRLSWEPFCVTVTAGRRPFIAHVRQFLIIAYRTACHVRGTAETGRNETRGWSVDYSLAPSGIFLSTTFSCL